MAKKKTSKKKVVRKKVVRKTPTRTKTTRRKGKPGNRDAETLSAISGMADAIVKSSLAQRDPHVDIPLRTLSNTRFNKSRRIVEMGSSTQRRNLFNLGQAKKFMQMVLQANSCRELIEADKTTSLRGMFYKGLHTIEGTKEKTFDDQSESDAVLEDLEVALGSLREELHLFADTRGSMVGNVTIVDNGDAIDCRRMGSGGYAIPSIVEPSVIQFESCEADFVLHVEKNTVWSRFNEDKFWKDAQLHPAPRRARDSRHAGRAAAAAPDASMSWVCRCIACWTATRGGITSTA